MTDQQPNPGYGYYSITGDGNTQKLKNIFPNNYIEAKTDGADVFLNRDENEFDSKKLEDVKNLGFDVSELQINSRA